MHVLEFTPERRREMFEAGRSLFFYCNGILGFKDLTENLHWDYCEFLQRPSLRKLVAVFRGGLKSSVGTVGFVSHRSLYIQDHMTKLVESSADNAYRNHFLPIYHIFAYSKIADMLFWLYGDYGNDDEVDDEGVPLDIDMRRIPEGFTGWNAKQIDFVRRGELALPSITYGGIDTKFEGWHGNLVLCDDLEGADEDKAQVPNEDALRFIDERAVPLLRDPGQDMIVDIGTLHGALPHLVRLRDREYEWRVAGNEPVWDIFWRPIINKKGECEWPERFTPETVAGLRQSTRMWTTQYMLEPASSDDHYFDLDQIRNNCWTWAANNQLISYNRKRFARSENGALIHDETGFPKIIEEPATVAPGYLRFFIHLDPKHIQGAKHSNAEAAIWVVGVNWDNHVFDIATWTGDVSLEEFAEQIYTYYRRYRPWKVTMGAVGAEHWFMDYAAMLERGKYRQIPSLPAFGMGPMLLPRLTSRLEMSKAHTQTAKGEWIVRQLESWFSIGLIHLRAENEHAFQQIGNIGNVAAQRDLIDSLAQGPKVWSFPQAPESISNRRSLVTRHNLLAPADPDTGYFNPWTQNPVLQLPTPLDPPHHPHTPEHAEHLERTHRGRSARKVHNPQILTPSDF